MKHYGISHILMAFFFCSCQEPSSLQDLFPVYEGDVVEQSTNIKAKDLGFIEGLHCNDSVLIVLDFQKGKSYSFFDITTGILKKRFGEIGHGNNEIPLGCVGSIWNNYFCIFDDLTGMVAQYNLNSLNMKNTCDTKIQYQITEGSFSRIIPIDSLCFMGMGTYKGQYQYVAFDNMSNVIDYAFEIYNANDESFDKYHKFLSNQGSLVKHPTKPLFAGAVRRSSNIDFFSFENNKIRQLNSLRYHNPVYSTVTINGLRRVKPSDSAINGFLDLCGNEKYVFALYSEEKQKKNPYYSHTLLVFDWNGRAICQIKMPNAIYYISANNTRLYTVEKNMEDEFIVKSYSFSL